MTLYTCRNTSSPGAQFRESCARLRAHLRFCGLRFVGCGFAFASGFGPLTFPIFAASLVSRVTVYSFFDLLVRKINYTRVLAS